MKKSFRHETQRFWSGERPPPVTTQWIWGWCIRFCPQVCRMLRKPIRAPRYFGSSESSRSVSETEWNRRVYRTLGFMMARGFSPEGMVKTTWKY
jgi:hypothetical protein